LREWLAALAAVQMLAAFPQFLSWVSMRSVEITLNTIVCPNPILHNPTNHADQIVRRTFVVKLGWFWKASRQVDGCSL
jgi:hypothetical protein